MSQATLVILLALTLGILVPVLARSRLPGWILWLLALTPVAALYLLNPLLHVISVHGFWHIAIVNMIDVLGTPPENPLFAGHPLSYPWGYHRLASLMAALLHQPAGIVFALLNLVALAGSLMLLHRIASALSESREARRMGVFYAIFGLTFAHMWLFSFLGQPDLAAAVDSRGIPAVVKFSNTNGMPLGMLAFLLFIYSTICILRSGDGHWRHAALIAAASFGAAYCYPILWSAIFGFAGLVSLVLLITAGRPALTPAFAIGGATLLGSLLCGPYLLALRPAQIENSVISLSGWPLLGDKLVSLIIILAPAMLLLLLFQQNVRQALLRQPLVSRLLTAAILVMLLLYLVLHLADDAEYKYRVLGLLLLGILLGVIFAGASSRQSLAAYLLTSLFLLPFAYDFSLKLNSADLPWPAIADDYLETPDGYLHRDPGEAALYDWIRSATPGQAVFIDSYLTIPVFGARPLLVGLDERMAGFSTFTKDGWGKSAWSLLTTISRIPAPEVEQRRALAAAIYQGGGSDDAWREHWHKLRQALGERPLYLVVRREQGAAGFPVERFQRLFRHDDTSVYLLRPPPSGG